MAGHVLPPIFTLFGEAGPRFYLSYDGNPPSHAGDGYFNIGDVIWNSVPTVTGILLWVCTTAGTGATATFAKSVLTTV